MRSLGIWLCAVLFTNGKSLQFIYTGHTKAEFHTPGNSILGDSNGAPPVAEKTITVDDLLISSCIPVRP